jgi:hypothetical protein
MLKCTIFRVTKLTASISRRSTNIRLKHPAPPPRPGRSFSTGRSSPNHNVVIHISVVEKANVKVEYAADLATLKYGSGFPVAVSSRDKAANSRYETSLFNLNNTMSSPTSLLAIAADRNEKVSGITHPWMYMGAMFATFCWHVEDLGVNSLNYSHRGGVKTWYVVPGKFKEHFDAYIKQKYCLNLHKQGLL